jgi:ABC-2 type transport system permease protein
MQGIVEEKQQRIAEVLLGCVSPFEMMLGKLLGVVAVSLTISSVYIGGTYVTAVRFGAASLVPPSLVAWFLVFLVLCTLVYGSLYMAVGAAAGDLKETQTLQMPVMLIVMLPLLGIGSILRDPNGKLAVIASFVPFSSPMLMTARLSTSADVPTWQPAIAAVGVLLMALACVWAAGRIFRVGLLMQGKGVRVGDLVKWVLHG